jgi:hypothetical protein
LHSIEITASAGQQIITAVQLDHDFRGIGGGLVGHPQGSGIVHTASEGEAYTGNRNQPEQLLRDGPLSMDSLSHKILCPTLAARLAARDEASYNL